MITALSNYDVMQGKFVYTHLHIMSFITIKFHEILLSCFRGVTLTKKTNRIDNLTDWSKTLYPPRLIAQGIKVN